MNGIIELDGRTNMVVKAATGLPANQCEIRVCSLRHRASERLCGVMLVCVRLPVFLNANTHYECLSVSMRIHTMNGYVSYVFSSVILILPKHTHT